MAQSHHSQKISARRIIIGIILFIILLLIAWAVRAHNHASAPGQSTNQAQPNVQQNVPPSGQVNKGANPNQDTVPSQNGTNGIEGSSR